MKGELMVETEHHSRESSEAGYVNSPDLHCVVIAASGQTEFVWMERNRTHSVQMAVKQCQQVSKNE